MRLLLVPTVLLCINLVNVDCAKILGVFPMGAPSHYFLGSTLMRALAERGHDVTMVSPYVLKDPPKNGTYRDVVITGMAEKMKDVFAKRNFFESGATNSFLNLIFVNRMMGGLCELTLANENVQKLVHSGEQFDLVIVENFMNEAQKLFAQHFGAPLVLFSPVGSSNWFNHFVGNPSPLSYIPEFVMETEGLRMTYLERVKNTALYWFLKALNHFYVFPLNKKLAQKYIGGDFDFDAALHNASLVLINGHSSLNQPVPSVPSMVYIGGFHVKPPKKLPQDLQEFLDASTEGVVLFSMGSNLKSANLPVQMREALLSAFAKLKLKVLWKWEDDSLPGQPPNVKLGKWLPQQDVLAHPNVKLFITHGGYLSTTEAIYNGVPVLGIPIFGDQKSNAKIAEKEGFGLTVDFVEIEEEKLSKTINELLSNPRYANNAKLKSRLFHDRPMSAMDSAIYWVEYVIRNRGAPHLRVAGLDLPWYQYYLVDVAALFLAIGLVLLYVNFLIARAVLRTIGRWLQRWSSKGKGECGKKDQ